MKIIARIDLDTYIESRKIMVEMTCQKFAMCAGVSHASDLPSTNPGTTLDVSKNFMRLRRLQDSSVMKAAKQLVAIAELLEPLQDVLNTVNCPAPTTKE
jgi:hypothetical protein